MPEIEVEDRGARRRASTRGRRADGATPRRRRRRRGNGDDRHEHRHDARKQPAQDAEPSRPTTASRARGGRRRRRERRGEDCESGQRSAPAPARPPRRPPARARARERRLRGATARSLEARGRRIRATRSRAWRDASETTARRVCAGCRPAMRHAEETRGADRGVAARRRCRGTGDGTRSRDRALRQRRVEDAPLGRRDHSTRRGACARAVAGAAAGACRGQPAEAQRLRADSPPAPVEDDRAEAQRLVETASRRSSETRAGRAAFSRQGEVSPLSTGNSGSCSSPAVSSRPNATFMFCIAWPAEPFTRLSSTEIDDGAARDAVGEHADLHVVRAAHVLRLRQHALRRDMHEGLVAIGVHQRGAQIVGASRRFEPHIGRAELAAAHRDEVRREIHGDRRADGGADLLLDLRRVAMLGHRIGREPLPGFARTACSASGRGRRRRRRTWRR